MTIQQTLRSRLLPKLALLYGVRAGACFEEILRRVEAAEPLPPPRTSLWDERDVVLITYGDQVRDEGRAPLGALGRFLAEAELDRLVSTIHLLPCFPASSDDGFSVIDYRAIDPAVGNWGDVAALGENYSLMLDLVLNHVSRESRWFADYLAGREPFTRFFIEVDPASDTSGVTRPRSSPLLTPVETSRGPRHVWTTFSDDQIDLNYAEPAVLVEMIDVLLGYLCRGARIVRLDAIAYLWKRPGTPCVHLPETHTVVKIYRDLVDVLAPGAILLTETNVPHEENVSYFGRGDEAQMVYQFSLAPLLLEALLTGNPSLLAQWLAGQEPTPPGTTTLNFTASHDGIGVRPLEGIMPPDRFARLLDTVRRRGGEASMRRNADGTESPYELNVSYFSALDEPGAADRAAIQKARFMASQAIMLSLRGIPAVYFHSLVATSNDYAGRERTGRARSINRRKYTAAELRSILLEHDSTPADVLAAYRRMLAVRRNQPAFHPEADQRWLAGGPPTMLALLRTSLDGRQRILVLANFAREERTIDVEGQFGLRPVADLLTGREIGEPAGRRRMSAYEVAWIVVEPR
ncbi:MAG TPA: sugar phosphorylase [Thermoguttaceae bacterium]|nr:sugar phosphorylase [Thermoguttaceae bacterium]